MVVLEGKLGWIEIFILTGGAGWAEFGLITPNWWTDTLQIAYHDNILARVKTTSAICSLLIHGIL